MDGVIYYTIKYIAKKKYKIITKDLEFLQQARN